VVTSEWIMRRDLLYAALFLASCNSTGSGSLPPRAALQVEPTCVVQAGSQYSSATGRKGTYLTVGILIALVGTETATQAGDPTIMKDHVGDKAEMRQLLGLSCDAFLPESESYQDALKDEREHSSCHTTLLDLAALDSGKPFSTLLQPRIARYWKIQSISPGFSSIEIGEGDGENLQITGIHPSRNRSLRLDAQGAQLSWNYSAGSADAFGASRISLAAECPRYGT